MTPWWIIVGLGLAAASVSTLGAGFSVFGLSQLFSGAATAVIAMSASLEFAKFVLAAYLHRTWIKQIGVFKYYLTSAVVVLSLITSMGIFGFLSNAYQSASSVLDSETIRATALKAQSDRLEQEIERINFSIDEIPSTRITKKMNARAAAEPQLAELKKKLESVHAAATDADLKLVDVKQRVGPLIYLARAFNTDIDQIVKWLILVFVLVFDPLAICLVIATSQALDSRRQGKTEDLLQTTPATSAATPAVSEAAPTEGQQVVTMRFVETVPVTPTKTESDGSGRPAA